MRYGIFSDVHGNLEALQAVLAVLKGERIDQLICLGDIVGYGANPSEVIQVFLEHQVQCVSGNHDWAVLGKVDIEYFNQAAKEAVVWTKKQLTPSDVEFLQSLPLVFKDEELIGVHGTLNKPEEFRYLFDIHHSYETFKLMDRPVCFAGHTHIPQIILQDNRGVSAMECSGIQMKTGGKYIINAGSVGQPRDGNPEASFCLFDSEAREIKWCRTAYPVEVTKNKIVAAGLPRILAYRLDFGC